jgi:hypothetical protein
MIDNSNNNRRLEMSDPLRGEWLFRIIDPWSVEEKDAKLPWPRIIIALLLLFGPLLVFSAIPSTTFGGNLQGKGSLMADIGIYAILFYSACTLVLLPITRRAFNRLIDDLLLNGIVDPGLRTFDQKSAYKGRFLRFLEWFSRMDGCRGLIWYLIYIVSQIYQYRLGLIEDKLVWNTSPAEPGTLFYVLRAGNEQPNLAGLWFFLLVAPIAGYLIMLIIRSVVVFAFFCFELASQEKLTISPLHPDGVGGLRPIGNVAFLFSLFTFIIGIAMAGMTANELIVSAVFRKESTYISTVLIGQLILWGLYIVMGTLFFFLPLLPLRSRMVEAKESYLQDAIKLQVAAELRHRTELQENKFEPDSLQGLTMLNNLIRTADEMPIWPFDKKTFLRFASLLITPLTPLVADQLPRISAWLKSYLGLSS